MRYRTFVRPGKRYRSWGGMGGHQDVDRWTDFSTRRSVCALRVSPQPSSIEHLASESGLISSGSSNHNTGQIPRPFSLFKSVAFHARGACNGSKCIQIYPCANGSSRMNATRSYSRFLPEKMFVSWLSIALKCRRVGTAPSGPGRARVPSLNIL